MTTTNQILQKLIFKDYYDNLNTEAERIAFRDFFVPKYMSYPTFYNRLKDNSWTEYDYEKLEELTHINFR